MNGDFQSFNIIRRILHGEFPGRDFNSYLGLGPSYLMSVGTALFGGTFAASLFAVNLLCHAVFVFMIVFLCRLGRAGLLVTACASLIPVTLEMEYAPEFIRESSFYSAYVVPMHELYFPGNSVLALRAALPYAVVAIAYVVAHRLSIQAKIERVVPINYFVAFSAALCAGVSLIWSNDYGLPTFAGIIGAYFLMFRRENGWSAHVIWTAAVSIGAIVIALGTADILTGGGLRGWFAYNSSIAREQFWYFNLGREFGASKLSQVPLQPLLIGVGCFLWIGIRNRRKFRLEEACLGFLIVTTLMAGYMTHLAGMNVMRYFLPFYVTVFGCGFYLLSTLVPERLHSTLAFVLLIATTVHVLGNVSTPAFAEVNQDVIAPFDGRYWMRVPEIGSSVPRTFDKAVAIGHEMRDVCTWKAIPETRRILSTYTTLMDTIAGSYTSARSDYLIHALGDENQIDVLRALAAPPAFVTTSRPELTQWEFWNRDVNWYFYRELVKSWRAVDRTTYATVWVRQPVSRPWIAQAKATCEILRRDTGLVDLRFNITSPETSAHVLDVHIRYSQRLLPAGFIAGAWRSRLIVEDVNTEAHGGWGAQPFGLPTDHDEWQFPVALRPGTPASLQVTALPIGAADVTVSQCTAEPAALASDFDNFPLASLIPSSTTDANQQNGIWTASRAPMFSVTDETDLIGLQPGTWLQFGSGARRQVRSVFSNHVQLDGQSLDPVRDGYPHRIYVDSPAGGSGPSISSVH